MSDHKIKINAGNIRPKKIQTLFKKFALDIFLESSKMCFNLLNFTKSTAVNSGDCPWILPGRKEVLFSEGNDKESRAPGKLFQEW